MSEQGRPDAILLTAEQTARALAISPRTLWTLTNQGKLPVVRIGRAVRYAMDDVLAFVAARRGSLNAQAPS